MRESSTGSRKRAQFGVRLPVAGPLADPSAILRVATEAERLGFDALWVHDYIVWTKELNRTHVSCGSIEVVREDQDPLFFESLTTLSFVAAATSRIRLGTAVLIMPYRNPIVAAKQLANLDVLSGGRLIAGIGVGARRSTNNQDFEVLGVPRTEKYARTREGVRILKEIWTNSECKFEGRFWSFPPTEIFPKPLQRPHPPIWFGGASPRAVSMVAELGNGWLPGWFSPKQYEERIRGLYEEAEEAGRGDVRFDIGTEIVACIADSQKEADERSRRTVESFTAGFTVTSPDQARESALIGSPEWIVQRVDAFVEAGVTHFELKFIYRTIDSLIEQLTLFSDAVIHRAAVGPVG
jgi:probable F420-dependent oxidoreductase